jgi:hypothetical protein
VVEGIDVSYGSFTAIIGLATQADFRICNITNEAHEAGLKSISAKGTSFSGNRIFSSELKPFCRVS